MYVRIVLFGHTIAEITWSPIHLEITDETELDDEDDTVGEFVSTLRLSDTTPAFGFAGTWQAPPIDGEEWIPDDDDEPEYDRGGCDD